jgi:chromosome segregation ATPase
LSAAPGPARGFKHSPITNSGGDPGLQDNHSQQTINDPHSFAQQLRGYLDHVEGESRNAAKENARLHVSLEEEATATQAITSQLQITTKRAEHAERELKLALMKNEGVVRDLTHLLEASGQLEIASVEEDEVVTKLRSKMNHLVERAEKAEGQYAQYKHLYDEYYRMFRGLQATVDIHRRNTEKLQSNLETSKAETASAKKELEQLRAVQKDLSALFQKGNDMLQGKRKQVIDREK